MPLANVALTDTYDTWRIRTNQIIIAIDQTDILLNSSITNATAGFSRANAANVLAFNTSVGANAWANTVGASANGWTNTRSTTIGVSGNNWTNTVGIYANTYANAIGASSNTWGNTVSASANAWSNTIGSRSNTWANTVSVYANTFANTVGAAANAVSSTKLANTSNVTFAGSLIIPAGQSLYTNTGVTSLQFFDNQIISGYNHNGLARLAINYAGYNYGNTQFRNVEIYDGKFNLGALFDGATKSLLVWGDVQANYTSDISLKENITPIANALSKVNSIRGVEFDWTDDHINKSSINNTYFLRKRDVGVIAQELETVLPEAVAQRDDGIKAVKYDRIIPLLIQAIKELSIEVEQLKNTGNVA